MNTAEAVLSLLTAGAQLSAEEVESAKHQFETAEALGYTAAPYEPQHLGTFTSALAYIIRAIVALKRSNYLKRELDKVLLGASRRLLESQIADGGWSWGPAAPGMESYVLFTVEAIDALEVIDEDGLSDHGLLQNSIGRAYQFLRDAQLVDGG